MREDGCSVPFPYRQSLPEDAQREHGQTLLGCREMYKSQKHKRVRKKAASLPAPSPPDAQHEKPQPRSAHLVSVTCTPAAAHRAGAASLV